MIELTDASSTVERLQQRGPILIAAALAGAFFLAIVQNPLGWLTIIPMGIVILVVVWKLWLLTRRDPIWLAFVLLLWELLSASIFFPDKIRPIISYGLTLLFCYPAIPILWRACKEPKSDFKLYLFYFGWCLVTVTYSLDPEYSLAHLIRSLLAFGAIAMCSVRARQTGGIQRVIRCMTLACVVMTLATPIASFVLPSSLTWGASDLRQNGLSPGDVYEVIRFQGPFDNPSRLGELALVTVGLVAAYFEFAKKKERIVLIVVALTAVGLMALADSRSGPLGLMLGGGLYALWRYRLKGLAAVAAVFCLIVVGLILGGQALAPYIWRGDVLTVTGRTDIWPFALRQIAARPITGYGYQVNGAIFESRYFQNWWGTYELGVHNSIHNGYLAEMVNVGIPAFILWLFIVLRPWLSLLLQNEDRWQLKRIFFFIVVPGLVVNFAEQTISDCLGGPGLLFTMVWALAEQYRLLIIRERSLTKRQAFQNLPPAVAVLMS